MNESPSIDSRRQTTPPPTAREGFGSDTRDEEVILDVREDIRQGREPFSRIMTAVAGLGADQQLRLIAPFEPVPLFHVLARQGFQHTARANESGDWEVLFTRSAHDARPPTLQQLNREQFPATNGKDRRRHLSTATDIVEVDARGLEPPQPLVMILEAVAGLSANSELHARTDRRPMHLYPQLEERGFVADTQEQSDGSFLTQIRRS